ncbi:GNAT family N-acetyltransferase [Streptosporangium sp. NPDC006007]|uniref:GNAT family N-acetyltransferase n=1 Tax=Streptosporangium sp. NPDC006007 TaxID=3154575 RepID=UPI0033A11999
MPFGLTLDAVPVIAAFESVYAEAFAPPPWCETPDQIRAFAGRLPGHLRTPGFRCRVAYLGGEPAGFAYGFPTKDPWPKDRLYGPVADAVVDVTGDLSILSTRFELHEVAVSPRFAGRGVGTVLVRDVAAEVGLSWLVTSCEATAAVRLYERLGWRCLHEFHVCDRAFRIYLSPAAPGCSAPPGPADPSHPPRLDGPG